MTQLEWICDVRTGKAQMVSRADIQQPTEVATAPPLDMEKVASILISKGIITKRADIEKVE